MENFWRLWGLILLIKLALAALIPLSADEAYYWVWAQHLQLSYFDHPPMVAWFFYLGKFLEPFGHAVRWPAVIIGHGLLAVWYYLLVKTASLNQLKNWIWLLLFSPLLGFGSIIVTPDLLVMFFWACAIFLALRCLGKKDFVSYIAMGAALGLGFCAKYHIVLFVPCLLAYITVEKKWREVRWIGTIATIISGLIFCLPVLLWNYQNNFASFVFQLKHGLEESYYDPRWTGDYLIGQILLIFPLVFWAALRGKVPLTLRWSYYFGWGPLLFFFLTSFKASVEANWPIIAYPALLTIAVFYFRTEKWKTYYVGFWGLLYFVVLASLVIPSLRKIHEKIHEPYQMQELNTLLQDYRPLYTSNYQIASSFWYFSKKPVFKLREMSRYDFFDTFPEATPQENKFYLVKRDYNGLPAWFSEQQWHAKEILKMAPNFVLLEFSRP